MTLAKITGAATTASTSYATPTSGATGPTITMTTGATCAIWHSANISVDSAARGYQSVAVSGATTKAADDEHALLLISAVGGEQQFGTVVIFDDLTPGVNTFRCMMKVQSPGNLTLTNRCIAGTP